MIRRKSTGPRKPKKVVANPRVPRTRNGNSETESQHFGKIRSMLRGMTRFWKPINAKRNSVKVGTGKNARYYCENCQTLHEKIEIDHRIPAGSLRSYRDLPGFCERLFVEDVSLLTALCQKCHKEKTHQ
jgi:hypothetical protein